MPVRSQPIRSQQRSAAARTFQRPNSPPVPVNDDLPSVDRDIVLHAALHHFARHGLGAAHAALIEAEKALAAGDLRVAHHWQHICSTFDRRLAARLRRPLDESAKTPALRDFSR
ncbi:hypothetical protein GCM10011515_07980 [Tsuneonella deserti]|uniref:Uncharacterized protein n=1 Tax=Tsuneonella deserti TaxID=2035528 RepID=A0ABQ1S2Z7_9SPHN|nr:hypothetical protein [Tsuneonella deserti]GGD90709.1 hypothetical protein GCM10011515_07980 [Tsuneonella deserti]